MVNDIQSVLTGFSTISRCEKNGGFCWVKYAHIRLLLVLSVSVLACKTNRNAAAAHFTVEQLLPFGFVVLQCYLWLVSADLRLYQVKPYSPSKLTAWNAPLNAESTLIQRRRRCISVDSALTRQSGLAAWRHTAGAGWLVQQFLSELLLQLVYAVWPTAISHLPLIRWWSFCRFTTSSKYFQAYAWV